MCGRLNSGLGSSFLAIAGLGGLCVDFGLLQRRFQHVKLYLYLAKVGLTTLLRYFK